MHDVSPTPIRRVRIGSFALLVLFSLLLIAALPLEHPRPLLPEPAIAAAQDTSPLTLDWSYPEFAYTRSVAWGDVDNDGDLDLAVGNYDSPNQLYRNARNDGTGLGSIPTVHVVQPHSVDSYGTAVIQDESVVEIPFVLTDPESDPAHEVWVFFSLNGGGLWQPALTANGTNILFGTLATSPEGTEYTFLWDTFQSGVFGQYDNVVLRLEASPDLSPRPNRIPGPFLKSSTTTQSFPLRVQGTLVRVVDDQGQPVPHALVYHLPAGQTRGGTAFRNRDDEPFTTNAQGYLPGRGAIRPGDQLIALAPISATETSTLYHTSAATTVTGMDAFTVREPGVQTLTVSSDNALLLFNLDVSLEWDARNDP